MKPAAFFRTPEVQRLLERASRAAGAPLAIHYVERGEEGVRVTGYGSCQACEYVSGLPNGKQSCRASRVSTSVLSLRRDKPIPFLCHMGFACVSMPALPGTGLGFTMTFGPYCPSEAPQSLESDALWGLAELGYNPEEGLPVSLSDIHLAPADSVPAVAEWTAESLKALWLETGDPEPSRIVDVEEEDIPTASARRSGRRSNGDGPDEGARLAAALAVGDHPRVRKLLDLALSETEATGRQRMAIRRLRTVAIVSGALESVQRAGLSVASCWERFPAFLDEIHNAKSHEALIAAATKLLGGIRRRTNGTSNDSDGLETLSRLVMAHLTDGITLKRVAAELGQHPTAITHRLQRKFGMSFSEYVGQMRVTMAKDLLRCTRLGTGEIARRVGIRDSSNFGKLFRKFEGMSPQEYRRRFGRKDA